MTTQTNSTNKWVIIGIMLATIGAAFALGTIPTRRASTDQVYTNEVYGYQMTLPTQWTVSGSNPSNAELLCTDPIQNPEFVEFSSQVRTTCSGVDYIAIDQAEIIVRTDEPHTIEQLTNDTDGVQYITFAGEQASQFIFNDKTELPAPQATKIMLNHAGRGYTIYVQQKEVGTPYDPSLDAILSTFTFTN